MYGYIYLIVNNVNGKTYVGKRKLYKKVWNNDGYMGSGKHLKPAQEKYGIENFEKFLITWTYSEKDACEKEKFWIAEYKRRGKAEYNISKGGDGGDIYHQLDDAGKNRMRCCGPKNGFYGKHHSEETRKRHSKWVREHQSGKNNPFYGKHHSEESKRKISESNKGKEGYWKGKHLSDEAKRKNAEAHKGRQVSEETRKKMSEAQKKRWTRR